MVRRSFITHISSGPPFPERTQLPNGTIVVRFHDRRKINENWVAWSYFCLCGPEPANHQTVDVPVLVA